MLIVTDFRSHGVLGQFFEHDVNVDETVAAAVHEDNGRLDVSCGKLGHLVVFPTFREAERGLHFVVVHLKGFVAHDLKPVDHALRRREGVKMWIRSQLLMRSYVVRMPAK